MGIALSRVALLSAVVLLAACGSGSAGLDQEPAQKVQLAPHVRQQGTSAADYANEVQQLYIAYFGRPADPGGLANFEAQLLKLGAPIDIGDLAADYKTNSGIASLIDSFGLSAESQALYGNGTTTQFVDTIFNNVLGRQPASSGQSFWVSAIDSGQTSKGDAALSIMAGAFANQSTQAGLDVDLINNRVSVAASFTGEVSSLSATASYAGSAAAQSARQLLAGVTSSTVPSALLQQIISVVQGLISSAAQSYAGNYCGTISGSFSGTVDLTLSNNGNGTFSAVGTAFVDGTSIPIQGTTQPPVLAVDLVCTTGVCGTVTGTVTASSITGSYTIPGVGSGNISLSRSCQ